MGHRAVGLRPPALIIAIVVGLAIALLCPSLAAARPVHQPPAANSPYATAVLADAPTLYYRLDDLNGSTATDSSGHGLDGTYQAGTQLGQPGALLSESDPSIAAGGRALVLDQSGDQLPGASKARTLETWVHYVCCNGPIALMQYGDVAGNHGFVVTLGDSAGSITVGDGTSSVTVNTIGDFAHGWHLLDVTYDGANAEVYIDGQDIGGGHLGAAGTVLPGQGFQVYGNAAGMGLDEIAVYPKALTPAAIDSHWSAGASSTGVTGCAAAPTAPFAQAVLADAPLAYYRLDELAGATTDRVAFDSSPNCANAAYQDGPTSGPGALPGDTDTGVQATSRSLLLNGSDTALPSGTTSRTFETYLHYVCCNGPITLMQYGDVAGGHGFYVELGDSAGSIVVGDGTNSVTIPTIGDFAHGWHLLDVTYDGATGAVELYDDGQVIGGATLTLAASGTVVPGQGLQMFANAQNMGLDEASLYGTALTPARINAHWSAGEAHTGIPACAPAATAPYAKVILGDSPLVYYRLDELSIDSADQIALDSSSHCVNAAYEDAPGATNGALEGDTDTAMQSSGRDLVLAQSGDTLPTGAGPRTFETWIDYVCCNGPITLMQYGDVAGGHGFSVTLGDSAGTIVVTAGAASVTANTVGDFAHGWHLLDVTYDGSAVEVYEDGQIIGGGTLGAATTAVPGQGFQMYANAQNMGLDEVAMYGSALSSATVKKHFEAQSLTPPGTSLIAGIATINGGGGAQGAHVQACPTSGGTCVLDENAVDSSGSFHMVVPDGTYTVTVFPPPGSPSSPDVIGPITLPPNDTSIDAVFTPPGGMPSGMTLDSPSQGSQQNDVPTVNWGEPSTLTIQGCKNGTGIVYVTATNTQTGQPQTISVNLIETPAGSGNYTGQIPPLAPMHGGATLDPQISCPGTTNVLPDGGPQGGGTGVVLTGSGFTGATAVHFGSAAATSFQVVGDTVITAVAPPGTGSVPVTVTTAQGSTLSIGTYNYFDVTGLSSQTGGAGGGQTITITGDGLGNVTEVIFGLYDATNITIINANEIQVTVPAGIGTVNVQVISGYGISQATQSSRYTYQGGPPGSSNVVEPLSGGNAAAASYASQVEGVCGGGGCDPGVAQGADEYNSGDSGSSDQSGLHDALDYGVNLLSPALALICTADLPGCAAAGVVVAAVGLGLWLYDKLGLGHVCILNFLGDCHAYIDPSGTVQDTSGNPINGATATILVKQSDGSFTAVDPTSGLIIPNVNPQTTPATGAFDWDALAGTYEIEASASGCHAPGNPAQPNVFTPAFTLPPPVTGLVMTLECPGSTPPPKPTVASLSVTHGLTAGGEVVDIAGAHLTDATTVDFGSHAATDIQVLSAYAIAATAPAGSGTVDVTVTTPSGTSATSAGDRYTYSPPIVTSQSPTVTGVSPASGPLVGGTEVTITGTNLSGAAEVQFGSSTASGLTVVSDTEVKAIAPASQVPARVDVTVRTANGTSAPNAADGFSYGSPPPPPSTTTSLAVSPNPAIVGHSVTLTATVAPTDGGGTVSFAADGSPLSGCGAVALTTSASGYQATCTTTTLSAGGHTVAASYSGDASYAASSGSTSISIVGTPANTGPPSIAGTTTQGQTLSEVHGSWSNSPTGFAYQWEDCDSSGGACTAISGATASTYVLSASDVGHTVRVQESASNAAGTSAPATSGATGVVQPTGGPPSPPHNTLPPVVSGAAVVGGSLSASIGTWSGSPVPTFAYQWQLCRATCSAIGGATSSTYTVAASDLGGQLEVIVTATNSAGSASATSNRVGPAYPSAATIKTALNRLLRGLRASRKLKFQAPSGGTLKLILALPRKHHHSGGGTEIAHATGHPAQPGAESLKLKLTGAGRGRLRHSRTVKVIATATFTPSGGPPVAVTRKVKLKR